MGFFEPQEKVWGEKNTGYQEKLEKMQQGYRSQILPFHGIGGFEASLEITSYRHTLFRFPLREKPNNMSKKTWTPKEMRKLILVFKEEADILLLFLRSVECVKVYEIDENGSHSLMFEVNIAEDSLKDLCQKKDDFKSRLGDAFGKCRDYGIQRPVYFTAEINVCVKSGEGTTTGNSEWLVSNWVGSKDHEVQEAAKNECIFPWVGTALKLGSKIERGRLFCTLPMPSETSTDLPVHVNGPFSLNDNRRTIKWPGKESQNDSTAQWNVLLVEKVIPHCYTMLLKEARKTLRLASKEFYDLMPNVDKIIGSNWEGLLYPLFSGVLDTPCLWSSQKHWIAKGSATFVLEESGGGEREEGGGEREKPAEDTTQKIVAGDAIQEVLTVCKYDIVTLPPNMWEAFKLVCSTSSLKILTPSLVRKALKNNQSAYEGKGCAVKLELLQFCLGDKVYSDLGGLHLLPLADGRFECFETNKGTPMSRYLYNKEPDPMKLLPNADHFLIKLENESLHSMVEDLAESGETQVEMLSTEAIGKLLVHIFPESWQDEAEVSLQDSAFSQEWFSTFWKWAKECDCDLRCFIGKLVVPIAHSQKAVTKVTKLKEQSGIVFVKKTQPISSDIKSCFEKLNIEYTLCDYLNHKKLICFLNPCTPDGVIAAFAHQPEEPLSRQEAIAFQSFLTPCGECNISQPPYKLRRFPIFLTIDKNSPPISLSSKTFLLEPKDFSPMRNTHSFLPSNLVILSADNQVLLLEFLDIKRPRSTAEFLIDYVFPCINRRNTHVLPSSNITCLMQEILKNFNVCSSYQFNVKVAELKFLQTNTFSSLFSPNTLFDPTKSELKNLYQGEFVFPQAPFDTEEYLPALRKCDLKCRANAQDLYNILDKVGGYGRDTAYVGEIEALRAKAVFSYIQNHSDRLREEYVSACSLPVQPRYHRNYSSKTTLVQAICKLAKWKSIFPFESEHPETCSYPNCLRWKGSGCNSHLAMMNDLVLTCETSEIGTFSSIVGSQMYIVPCPSYLSSRLRPSPPAEKVVDHLMTMVPMVTTQSLNSDDYQHLDSMIHQVYNYLMKHVSSIRWSTNLRTNEWIWLDQKFIQSIDVALEHHPEMSHLQLSPYLHIISGNRNLSNFSSLFGAFGAHKKVTDELLVSVLERISRDKTSDPRSVWEIVHAILHWVTKHGKAPASEIIQDQRALYVPIESESDALQLVPVKDVAYVDMDPLNCPYYKNKCTLKFVHNDFYHLGRYLGAVPLSKHLGISDAVLEDFDQSEKLVDRITDILMEYKDGLNGLTIIKELILNADDSGATDVNICYDSRQHGEENLLFPGMAKAHGPAFVVQSNSSVNNAGIIRKLAGIVEKNRLRKFGLGLYSTYHLTDVPSFVSKDELFIFDPTLAYLDGNPCEPIQRLCFPQVAQDNWMQMKPYIGLFGFKNDESYPHTIFRFPFRTSLSSISSTKYGEREVNHLISDIKKEGAKLLIFMKNVSSITFSRIDSDQPSPTQLLKILKEVITDVPKGLCVTNFESPEQPEMPCSEDQLGEDEMVPPDDCGIYELMPCNEPVSEPPTSKDAIASDPVHLIPDEMIQAMPESKWNEPWLSTETESQLVIASVPIASHAEEAIPVTDDEPKVSATEIATCVQEADDMPTLQQFWLVPEVTCGDRISAVACELIKTVGKSQYQPKSYW